MVSGGKTPGPPLTLICKPLKPVTFFQKVIKKPGESKKDSPLPSGCRGKGRLNLGGYCSLHSRGIDLLISLGCNHS